MTTCSQPTKPYMQQPVHLMPLTYHQALFIPVNICLTLIRPFNHFLMSYLTKDNSVVEQLFEGENGEPILASFHMQSNHRVPHQQATDVSLICDTSAVPPSMLGHHIYLLCDSNHLKRRTLLWTRTSTWSHTWSTAHISTTI